jgi:5-(aminomethyl)-3-furanmethanol phosphate kinase
MIVVKLGGSLIHRAKEIVKEIVDHSDTSCECIMIVPGGSVFADTVRKVKASGEASHWMAVLAMEQYGYYIADGSEAEIVYDIDIEDEGTYILLPYALLKKKDELPHTWDVTSDTIAAWVAHSLGARFIKLTDVDGIFLDGDLKKELNAHELLGIETCVDGELPRFLIKNKMNCEILNGNCPGRLVNAFKGNVQGTLIKG